MKKTINIFFCYAREDEWLLNQLKTHLIALQRQELIDIWHDRNISAGAEWEREINKHLNEADIILLLISPDFMASDYCYSIEMKRAMERHEQGDACVIPVIVRAVYWQRAPFGKLQALPTDAQPILSSRRYLGNEALHHYLGDAFFDVAEGIREAAGQFMSSATRHFDTAYQADDDGEILIAYEEIQRAPNAQTFIFTPQEQQRIEHANQKMAVVLHIFREALTLGRPRDIVAVASDSFFDRERLSQEEQEQLRLVRRFTQAFLDDDDLAIVAAYDAIATSPLQNRVALTYEEVQRIDHARRMVQDIV